MRRTAIPHVWYFQQHLVTFLKHTGFGGVAAVALVGATYDFFAYVVLACATVGHERRVKTRAKVAVTASDDEKVLISVVWWECGIDRTWARVFSESE